MYRIFLSLLTQVLVFSCTESLQAPKYPLTAAVFSTVTQEIICVIIILVPKNYKNCHESSEILLIYSNVLHPRYVLYNSRSYEC